MSHRDRVLYVESLKGVEKAKDAKGGGGRTYERATEEYVKAIDDAYQRGDTRKPDEIFGALR